MYSTGLAMVRGEIGFTEDTMRTPHIDDFVRLQQDIPELALHRGAIGVVRSTWFAPSIAYEVEFHQIGHDYQTRALLMPEQLEVEDGPLLGGEQS